MQRAGGRGGAERGTNEGEMELNGGEERLRASREIMESLLALKNCFCSLSAEYTLSFPFTLLWHMSISCPPVCHK